MKREMDGLFLRDAFGPMPDDCRAAMMHAVRSVKEDDKMKHAPFRAVLIAAIVIISMMAVALAATGLMGWNDFYRDFHGSGVGVPDGVYEQLQSGNPESWQVGPLTFTATELLTDGHIVISAVHVRTTDGSPALITGANTSDPIDPIRANGENGLALEKRLGLPERATWLEAAVQLSLPLYRVSADQDMMHELMDGDMMVDVLYNEDGSLTYFCMGMLDSSRVGEVLTMPMCLDAMLTDPATGETAQRWRDYDRTVNIPVCPLLEARSYAPEGEALHEGHRLLRAEAVRYVTGAYLTLTYDMYYMDVPDSAHALYDVQLCDESGAPLPRGMSLSGRMNFTITLEKMLGVDALPDVLTLSDGTVLRAE